MSKKKLTTKSIICLALICLLAIGILAIPFSATLDPAEAEVSDYFFVQIYDSDDNVLSKYQVTLTGCISRTSQEITDVECSFNSGDICTFSHQVIGNMAVVTLTHPTQGFWEYSFVLNSDGTFSGF